METTAWHPPLEPDPGGEFFDVTPKAQSVRKSFLEKVRAGIIEIQNFCSAQTLLRGRGDELQDILGPTGGLSGADEELGNAAVTNPSEQGTARGCRGFTRRRTAADEPWAGAHATGTQDTPPPDAQQSLRPGRPGGPWPAHSSRPTPMRVGRKLAGRLRADSPCVSLTHSHRAAPPCTQHPHARYSPIRVKTERIRKHEATRAVCSQLLRDAITPRGPLRRAPEGRRGGPTPRPPAPRPERGDHPALGAGHGHGGA